MTAQSSGRRKHPGRTLDIINETPATGEGDFVFSVDGEKRDAL